jgi:hypothetical protein
MFNERLRRKEVLNEFFAAARQRSTGNGDVVFIDKRPEATRRDAIVPRSANSSATNTYFEDASSITSIKLSQCGLRFRLGNGSCSYVFLPTSDESKVISLSSRIPNYV